MLWREVPLPFSVSFLLAFMLGFLLCESLMAGLRHRVVWDNPEARSHPEARSAAIGCLGHPGKPLFVGIYTALLSAHNCGGVEKHLLL